MSNKVNDTLFEHLASLGGIWYENEETLDEALARTRGRFGSYRRAFADLFGYKTTNGVTYVK